MFDVLGFRAIVKSTPLDHLVASYKRLLREKLEAAAIPVFGPGGLRTWRNATTIFSDTILLWAPDTPEALDTLLAASSVMLARFLEIGWPLRGGIARGEAVLDRQRRMFLGQPIVDAHDTETAQEWVGASFHSSCFARPESGRIIRNHDCVRLYSVPVKTGATKLDCAVHWADRVADPLSILLKMRSEAKDTRAQVKYDNTLSFVKTLL
jgi:hypothetical protein